MTKTWKGHIFDSIKGENNPSNYKITDLFVEAINKNITWEMVDVSSLFIFLRVVYLFLYIHIYLNNC
jgi:hypothetical protein